MLKNTGFADRLKTAAAAKQAQLEKFTPRPTAPDAAFVGRQERRAAELAAVRQARAEQRQADQKARAEAAAAAAAAVVAAEFAALEARRLERKNRKQSQKADADARRQDRRDSLELYARVGAGSVASS
ncbi:MAG: DUF6481 family protein [Caulobacteraceae bacterium]|nr:DUF6481 family protein [Caulobacteraceae bacterium]